MLSSGYVSRGNTEFADTTTGDNARGRAKLETFHGQTSLNDLFETRNQMAEEGGFEPPVRSLNRTTI